MQWHFVQKCWWNLHVRPDSFFCKFSFSLLSDKLFFRNGTFDVAGHIVATHLKTFRLISIEIITCYDSIHSDSQRWKYFFQVIRCRSQLWEKLKYIHFFHSLQSSLMIQGSMCCMIFTYFYYFVKIVNKGLKILYCFGTNLLQFSNFLFWRKCTLVPKSIL